MDDIAIVGLGVNGLTLALLLQKNGINVTVYESAKQPRVTGTGIYIWPQGFSILSKLVDESKLKSIANEVTHLTTLTQYGEYIDSKAQADAEVDGVGHSYMFHRKELYELLLSELHKGQIKLDKKCVDIVSNNFGSIIKFADGTQVSAKIVIASDGVYSKVRDSIFPGQKCQPTNVSVSRGMVNFELPNTDPQHCNIYSGEHARIVTYLVERNTHYRYWFAAYHDPLQRPLSKNELLNMFSDYHPDLVRMIRETPEDQIIPSHLYDVPIHSTWSKNNVILIGDSAHAILPTLGYGFSLGLENVYTLAMLLVKYNCEYEEAFSQYEYLMLERTRGISDISRQFTELFYMSPKNSVCQEKLQKLYREFFSYINDLSYLSIECERRLAL